MYETKRRILASSCCCPPSDHFVRRQLLAQLTLTSERSHLQLSGLIRDTRRRGMMKMAKRPYRPLLVFCMGRRRGVFDVLYAAQTSGMLWMVFIGIYRVLRTIWTNTGVHSRGVSRTGTPLSGNQSFSVRTTTSVVRPQGATAGHPKKRSAMRR